MIKTIIELFNVNPLSGIESPLSIIIIITIILIISGSILIKSNTTEKWSLIKDYFTNNKVRFILVFFLYFITGILQQGLLVLIYKGFQYINPDSGWNMIYAAGSFAILHFPNFILMFSVMGISLVFLHHYGIYENIYIIGIYHGLLGNFLKFMLPEELKTSFTVGFKYIRLYKKKIYHNLLKKRLKNILEEHIKKSTYRKEFTIYTDINVWLEEQDYNSRKSYIIINNDGFSEDTTSVELNKKPCIFIEILDARKITIKRNSKFNRLNHYHPNEYWLIDPLNRIFEIFYTEHENNKYILYDIVNDMDTLLASPELGEIEIDFNKLFTRFKFFKMNPFI
jgi:Uma2 family endonuclease